MITKGVSEEVYKNKVYGNTGNKDVLSQVPSQSKTILDVGCGAGDNAKILKALSKHVTGITISEKEAGFAKEICDVVKIVNIEVDAETIQEKYDVIILSHVCEHLRYPVQTLNNLAKNLSNDGVMIVAVPNMAFYKNRLKLLKGDWTMQESGPFDKTHLQFFSYHTADTLCDETQVRLVKKIPGFLAIPLWPFRSIFPTFCKNLDNYIGKRFPNLFAQQTILVIEA
jgi:2-polyprenyl-3-methyl-5-hydroxy-6-metoxy-1,4-benzoquinol methylase